MIYVRLIVRFSYVLLIIAALWLSSVTNVYADTWRGTAPFCKGKCLPGEVQIQTSTTGNGGKCVTGKKVLCRNQAPLCQGQQTRTSCKAFILICDNGYYEAFTNGTFTNSWRSCSKYACGTCFGWS